MGFEGGPAAAVAVIVLEKSQGLFAGIQLAIDRALHGDQGRFVVFDFPFECLLLVEAIGVIDELLEVEERLSRGVEFFAHRIDEIDVFLGRAFEAAGFLRIFLGKHANIELGFFVGALGLHKSFEP